ncbi:MAG TPA: serine hydrolase domain-containing protein [Chloroflexota bacterium]|nr:serine hydrolase domain-containing protein [Chloroflexota bacterium]
MRHIINCLALCVISVLLAACGSAPSATPAPTSPPPTPTAPLPTATSLPPTATAVSPEVMAEIDALLADLAEQGLFSGAVLVGHQGNIMLSQGYGLADREQAIPNTPQTRFRIAALTKQFTAMAILILEAQGKLNVQDPICNYLPDCPAIWQDVTIHHLLTHTAGMPYFTPPLKEVPLDFEPGEQWRYTHGGYLVLGYIIEAVSGQTDEEFLQEAIFTPLNLSDTGYEHNSDTLAIGYKNRFGTEPAEFIDMSIAYAAGALYSTVEDLYRWEQALSTEQLVPQAYLDEMFAPQVATNSSTGIGSGYGYGWFTGVDDAGRPRIAHDGVINGFASVIARYPTDHLTIIVLSNQEQNDATSLELILSRKIFGDE